MIQLSAPDRRAPLPADQPDQPDSSLPASDRSIIQSV
jgi:hypothetical protein